MTNYVESSTQRGPWGGRFYFIDPIRDERDVTITPTQNLEVHRISISDGTNRFIHLSGHYLAVLENGLPTAIQWISVAYRDLNGVLHVNPGAQLYASFGFVDVTLGLTADGDDIVVSFVNGSATAPAGLSSVVNLADRQSPFDIVLPP